MLTMTMDAGPREDYSGEEGDSSGDEDVLWVALGRRLLRNGPARTWTIPSKPTFRSGRGRSSSAPPAFTTSTKAALVNAGALSNHNTNMLATATIDLAFDDDDWVPPPPGQRLFRAASVGNSWGVTSIGRGFDWQKYDDDDSESSPPEQVTHLHPGPPTMTRDATLKPRPARVNTHILPKILHTNTPGPSSSLLTSPILSSISPSHGSFISGPMSRSPPLSRPASPHIVARTSSPHPLSPSSSVRPPLSRTPTSPRLNGPGRSRRRSSQQRVSLIAGRVSILPVEPPSPPPITPQTLVRANSAASFLSVATSTGPPTPNSEVDTLNERSISEFVIEREIGRGAYGLVKRAREMNVDGTLGVSPLLVPAVPTMSAHAEYEDSLLWSSSRSSNRGFWQIAGKDIRSTALFR